MINVSNASANLIEQDSRSFKVRIVHGENKYEEIRTFKKSVLFPSSAMSVGNALSACIECTAEDVPVSIIGAEIEAYITVLGSDEWIRLGVFKAEKPTIQDGTVKFTAFDAMTSAGNKTYVSTLSGGTHTVQEYFSDICKVLGKGCVSLSNAKGSVKITADKLSGYSCRDALAYLSGFIGYNCIVNHDGLFEMKPFTQVDYSLLNPDRTAEPELSDSDCVIGYIACCVDDENTLQSGTGSVGFEFISPIMTQTQLNSVGAELMGSNSAVRVFRAGKIKQLLGDPRLEICDVVNLNFGGRDYTVPITSLTLDFDGGLQAEIESFDIGEVNSLSLSERLDFAAKQATQKATRYTESALKFSETIGNAMGLYQTAMQVGSGTIFYSHDKPTLEKSTYITCNTSEGFAYATSWGGSHDKTTWYSGITKDGNAILKMLTAYKINADMIEVDNLYALSAKIGAWNISDRTIYQTRETSSGTYSVILANYDSDTDESRFLHCQKNGSDVIQMYRSGRVVFKDADNTKTKIEFADGTQKFYYNNNLYGQITTTVSNNQNYWTLLAHNSNIDAFSIGFESEEDTPYYFMHRKPQNDEIKSVHTFNGNVKLLNHLDVYGGIAHYGKRMLAVDDNGNLLIGSDNQSGNTNIYAVPGGTIGMTADVRIGSGKGIHFNAGAWSRAIYYGDVGGVTGFYLGIDAQNMYLRGNAVHLQTGSKGIYYNGYPVVSISSSTGSLTIGSTSQANNTVIYAPSNKGIGLTAQYIQISGELRIASSRTIQFNTPIGNVTGIRFGDVSTPNGTLTGFHVGIGAYNTYLWGTTMLSTGAAVTSDKNAKKNIEPFTEKHEALFNELSPRTFKYKDGTSDRTHFGFIAQEVKEAIEKADLTTQEVAAYIAIDKENDAQLALRYEEFIALNTHMIKKCMDEIAMLKQEITNLKEAFNNG